MIIKKKIWIENFEAVLTGKKKAELRLNDFEIHEGDTLHLEEWDKEKEQYTGRKIEKRVTHIKPIMINDFFGQEEEIKEKGVLLISLE